MAAHTYHAGDHADGIRVTPRPIDLTKVRRDRLEALVEHLIWLLDVWDGDDDREPHQDAEPSDDDEASAQPAVTPDSTRPTLPLPVMVRA